MTDPFVSFVGCGCARFWVIFAQFLGFWGAISQIGCFYWVRSVHSVHTMCTRWIEHIKVSLFTKVGVFGVLVIFGISVNLVKIDVKCVKLCRFGWFEYFVGVPLCSCFTMVCWIRIVDMGRYAQTVSWLSILVGCGWGRSVWVRSVCTDLRMRRGCLSTHYFEIWCWDLQLFEKVGFGEI